MPAGHSGAPLVTKLGIKPGHRVVLRGAPAGWTPGIPPDGARVVRRASAARADILVAFVRERSALEACAAQLSERIVADGTLWIAWPRRAGGHSSDITDTGIREVLLPLGLVDVKVAAFDEDWSGLKFVWRTELRASRR